MFSLVFVGDWQEHQLSEGFCSIGIDDAGVSVVADGTSVSETFFTPYFIGTNFIGTSTVLTPT